jgi:hypothetical protein
MSAPILTHPAKPIQHASERPLLPRIPQHQRGPVFNIFLDQIRIHGITDPQAIVSRVLTTLRQTLARRAAWTPEHNLDSLTQAILAIASHPSEALALAKEAVLHEQFTSIDTFNICYKV